MPGRLSLEPSTRTAATTAIDALATSPWAPLAAVGGQKQVLLYNTQSLELIASVAQHEQDRELRQLALRVLGYSAPKQYVGVMHGYFDSGQYDHLVLRVFLAAYGREEWVRTYVNDADLHPKVRAAALYDYSRSGFEVPGSMISFMQDTARHDSEYDVRQAAGQSLRHLGAWVPLKTRLERQENQLMTLFAVWQAAVGVYLLGALVGVFFFVVRWSRVRQRFSVVGIFGWFAVVIALVPAVGFGALSLFRHNGPVPTSGEMFLVFLPTYVLVALFGYTTLQIIRAGMAERVPLTVATAGVVAVNRP